MKEQNHLVAQCVWKFLILLMVEVITEMECIMPILVGWHVVERLKNTLQLKDDFKFYKKAKKIKKQIKKNILKVVLSLC